LSIALNNNLWRRDRFTYRFSQRHAATDMGVFLPAKYLTYIISF
jgi:hypothetical protein